MMRVMAVAATHLAFEHRMMVRQVELSALVQMALKTGLRRFARVDDGVARATRLIVQAARPVAGLAARVLGVVARRLQSSVCGGLENLDDLLVTLRAGLRPDEFGAGNVRRRQHRAVDRGAGDGGYRGRHNTANHKQSSAVDVSLPGITALHGRVMQWISHRCQGSFGGLLHRSETFILVRQNRRERKDMRHSLCLTLNEV